MPANRNLSPASYMLRYLPMATEILHLAHRAIRI
jgi:hypothetical protein